MSKYTKQVIGFPTPLEMANANPLDSRFVVTSLDDLTNVGDGTPWLIKDDYTNVYPGIQVYVTAEHATYMYVGDIEDGSKPNKASVSNITNWRKISDANTSSDKLLSNINVNGKEGSKSDHVASITVEGADVHLGSGYNGTVISGVTGEVISPTSADTINDSFKKIVKIISDDEQTIAASANDLNTRINGLSGKAVTEITANQGGTNGEITLSNLTKSDGTIQYKIAVDTSVYDCGTMTGNDNLTA